MDLMLEMKRAEFKVIRSLFAGVEGVGDGNLSLLGKF